MSKPIDAATLRHNLTQFHGTDVWHRHAFGQLLLTEGALYFANQAGAHWFIDIVATELLPLLATEPFLSIRLVSKDGMGSIIATDGNSPTALYERQIDFTDCPEGVWRFFLVDNVLMLPGEY